jgi:predicted metalloprotease with PDZ domain
MAFASGTLLILAQAVLWPSAESWVRPQANDTIDIRLHVEPGRVLVEMHLPPVPVPIPGFALWPWGGADLARDLSELRAFNEAGEAVLVRETAPGEWEVPLGGGRLSLEYRVNAWKESFTGERRSDVYRPTLTEDLAVVGGRSWFLQPLEGRLALSPVRVAVTGPYREPELLGSRNGVFEDTRMVGSSLLVAGDVRRHEAVAAGLPVRFWLRGEGWRFSDDDLIEAVVKIVELQADLMEFVPGGGLEVLLFEGARDHNGGTADGNIITLFPNPGLRLVDRDPQTLRLVAHEHLHRWIGEYASGDPLRGEGRYKWFQEGVTEYLAYRTLVMADLLDPADFVFKINQYIERYVENPRAFTATADVLEDEYWDDPDLQELPYDKGFLLGLALDAMIRASTDGAAGVEDYVKAVVTPDGPVDYDDAILLAELERLTAESWQAFYESYVLGVAPLPLEEVCRIARFDCQRDRGRDMQLYPTNRTRQNLERLMRPRS